MSCLTAVLSGALKSILYQDTVQLPAWVSLQLLLIYLHSFSFSACYCQSVYHRTELWPGCHFWVAIQIIWRAWHSGLGCSCVRPLGRVHFLSLPYLSLFLCLWRAHLKNQWNNILIILIKIKKKQFEWATVHLKIYNSKVWHPVFRLPP